VHPFSKSWQILHRKKRFEVASKTLVDFYLGRKNPGVPPQLSTAPPERDRLRGLVVSEPKPVATR
jgi:hypothetical protein